MKIKQNIFMLGLLLIFSAAIFGQQDTGNQTTADEDFHLNIANKEITRSNYESKLEVAVESETKPALALKVGAGVKAEKIALKLTNISGDVRFKGSLEKILNQINLRRQPVDKEN